MTLEAILFNECQQLNKIPELFGIELIDMIQNAEVVDVNDLIQNSNVVNDDINVETNNVPFEPTIESVWTIAENEELCTEVVVDIVKHAQGSVDLGVQLPNHTCVKDHYKSRSVYDVVESIWKTP